jgi:hypothetical protein
MNKSQIINITISITLIFIIGLVTGYSIGYFRATVNEFPEIKFTDDINEGVATIKLMEIKNGKLSGEVAGRDVRIAYSSKKIVDLNKGDIFEIPLNEINLKSYYQTKSIPSDALFVASKNGKYYYSVLDKRAFNLSTSNRIFFSNSEEAEKLGYIKK